MAKNILPRNVRRLVDLTVADEHQTNHAEHFLTRIDRLDIKQAELALGLYRDTALVRFLLQKAKIPSEADRVAISLVGGEQGPFVIVTREGRFVTCLGEGMRLHADQPVVSHRTLHRLSGQIEALRELLQESAAGKRKRCDQLLAQVLEKGHTLSQRDFDGLVALSPLVGSLYAQALFAAVRALLGTIRQARTVKRFGPQSAPLLQAHWKALWATAHLTMLAGHEGEQLARLFELVDTHESSRGRGSTSTLLSLWVTGLLSWGLRGCWLAAKLPKVFLRPLKDAYAAAKTVADVRTFGFALAAIGHRHCRYRQEIIHFIEQPRSSDDDELAHFRQHTARLLVQGFEPEVLEAQMAFPALEAAQMVKEIAQGQNDPKLQAQVEQLSAQAIVSIALNSPLTLDRDEVDYARSYLYLPAVAQMEARDFYLPDEHRSLLFASVVHPSIAEEYLSPALEMAARSKAPPAIAIKIPGRNAACSCGSGKKYKRCCALAA